MTAQSSAEYKRIDQLVKSLEDYEVLKPLGKGGMGLIYLVRQRLTNRTEVLKVLRPELAQRQRLKDRFMREVQVAARLDHPNVVKTYTAIDRGFLGLVIEYVPGLDLESMVRQFGPLRVDHAASIIAQVARGLDYAVGCGLVHRDIKPSNILVSKSGETFRAKLSDFGLCKDMEFDEADGLTVEGRFLGTPEYVAPEQALDPANSTVVSDIYGLGCTLYFALSGSPPYRGPNTIAVVNAHINSPIPDVRAVRPDVPDEMRRLIESMLQKDPRARAQSPLALAESLESFLAAPRALAPAPARVAEVPTLLGPSSLVPIEAESSAPIRLPVSSAASQRRRPRPVKAKKRGLPISTILTAVMPIILLLALVYFKPWQAPGGPGTLVLSDVTPGVIVEVDGASIELNGRSLTELSLAPGNHKLRFLYGDRELSARDIVIQSRGKFEVAASFTGLEKRRDTLHDPPPRKDSVATDNSRSKLATDDLPGLVVPDGSTLEGQATKEDDKPATGAMEEPSVPKRIIPPIAVSTEGSKLELMRMLSEVRGANRLVMIPRDVIQNRNEIVVSFGDGIGRASNALLAWDVKQGVQTKFDTPLIGTAGIQVASNEKSLLYFNGSNCEVWTVEKQRFSRWFKSDLEPYGKRIFAISNDCRSLGCLDHSEQFSKWNLAQRKVEGTVSSQEPLGASKVSLIALTPRLDTAFALSQEGELSCWETNGGKVLAKIKTDIEGEAIGLFVANQTNQPQQVILVSSSGELKSWKLPALDPVLNGSVFEEGGTVCCLSNRLLAVASTKGEVALIDWTDPKIIGKVAAKEGTRVVGLAISEDNKTFAVGYESTMALYALRRAVTPANQKEQQQ